MGIFDPNSMPGPESAGLRTGGNHGRRRGRGPSRMAGILFLAAAILAIVLAIVLTR